MYSAERRSGVLRRRAAGQSLRSIARDLDLAVKTVHRWTREGLPAPRPTNCWRCPPESPAPALVPAYTYLLGQYLGDGYLVTSARVPRLQISRAYDYPGIAADVDATMLALSGNSPGAVARIGCSDRFSYWMHWPCLFPQHGPGRKHERPIVLAEWQREIVAAHPWPLIRGLIHSDGCRAINRVVVRGKAYSYPRYFSSNESRDILAIMDDALHAVGVEWRYNRPNSISIARRASVELMDRHVGPKR